MMLLKALQGGSAHQCPRTPTHSPAPCRDPTLPPEVPQRVGAHGGCAHSQWCELLTGVLQASSGRREASYFPLELESTQQSLVDHRRRAAPFTALG